MYNKLFEKKDKEYSFFYFFYTINNQYFEKLMICNFKIFQKKININIYICRKLKYIYE